MEYGGIYLDLDVLITRPFDELRRQFACTIGREQETKACGSVIVCSQHSPFLLLWINSYIDDYRIEEWAYNTGQVRAGLVEGLNPCIVRFYLRTPWCSWRLKSPQAFI